MFLIKTDLKTAINTYRLDQILDGDDTLFERAASAAQSKVNDKLFSHYDTTVIFAATGADRSETVLQWLRHIAIYYLYEGIPDDKVPERVIKNYDDAMAELDKIAEGKQAASLPRLETIDEFGNEKVKTKFRGGSQPARSH